MLLHEIGHVVAKDVPLETSQPVSLNGALTGTKQHKRIARSKLIASRQKSSHRRSAVVRPGDSLPPKLV
jgi:hypothetical protein